MADDHSFGDPHDESSALTRRNDLRADDRRVEEECVQVSSDFLIRDGRAAQHESDGSLRRVVQSGDLDGLAERHRHPCSSILFDGEARGARGRRRLREFRLLRGPRHFHAGAGPHGRRTGSSVGIARSRAVRAKRRRTNNRVLPSVDVAIVPVDVVVTTATMIVVVAVPIPAAVTRIRRGIRTVRVRSVIIIVRVPPRTFRRVPALTRVRVTNRT